MQELTLKDITIFNPYKSKIKIDPNLSFNKNVPTKQKDWNVKKIKQKYSKPYFSNQVNSWDGDLAFIPYNAQALRKSEICNRNGNQVTFLFLVNINTRYLHVIDINSKKTNDVKEGFEKLFQRGIRINNLRFDGEPAIESLINIGYFDKKGITVYNHRSDYTNYCEIVNRVIRTIRDLLFNSNANITSKKELFKILSQIVFIYNNSYHSGIGMKPVEMTYEYENEYIKDKQRELFTVNSRLNKNGFKSYKYGDKVLVFIDESRTSSKFAKKRGNYVNKAIFIGYTHGNCMVLPDNFTNPIEVPIYCVKKA